MISSSHSHETKDAGFRQKMQVFATKCENLFPCIHYFSMCLAAAEKVLWPIICRLSGNNRPITDYLKNGRLFTDPNSKSSGILSDGPVKDILRPV
jgi:hypothetical protein